MSRRRTRPADTAARRVHLVCTGAGTHSPAHVAWAEAWLAEDQPRSKSERDAPQDKVFLTFEDDNPLAAAMLEELMSEERDVQGGQAHSDLMSAPQYRRLMLSRICGQCATDTQIREQSLARRVAAATRAGDFKLDVSLIR